MESLFLHRLLGAMLGNLMKFGCTKKLHWGDLDKNENLQKRILLTHGMIFDHFSLAAIFTEMNNLEWVVHVFDPLGSKN